MKILKPGKVEQRKLECPWCGCVFVASENELEKDGVFGTYSTICPNLECGEHISGALGTPYEEPALGKDSDRARLHELICAMPEFMTSSEEAEFLIDHGVTFREVK